MLKDAAVRDGLADHSLCPLIDKKRVDLERQNLSGIFDVLGTYEPQLGILHRPIAISRVDGHQEQDVSFSGCEKLDLGWVRLEDSPQGFHLPVLSRSAS